MTPNFTPPRSSNASSTRSSVIAAPSSTAAMKASKDVERVFSCNGHRWTGTRPESQKIVESNWRRKKGLKENPHSLLQHQSVSPCSVWFDSFLVFWSSTGSLVTITAEDSFYILRCFQRNSRRRRGYHWWMCWGGIEDIGGVSLESFLLPNN